MARRIGPGTTADNGASGTCRAGIIESISRFRKGGRAGEYYLSIAQAIPTFDPLDELNAGR